MLPFLELHHLQIVISLVKYNCSFLICCYSNINMTLIWTCSVWHDTAIPFKDVLQEFEAWLTQHELWGEEVGGCLNQASFVTW